MTEDINKSRVMSSFVLPNQFGSCSRSYGAKIFLVDFSEM